MKFYMGIWKAKLKGLGFLIFKMRNIISFNLQQNSEEYDYGLMYFVRVSVLSKANAAL